KAAIVDIFQLGATAGAVPLFRFINEQLVEFRDKFISGDQFFKPALQSLVTGIQDFFKTILPSVRVALNEFGALLNALGGGASAASSAVRLAIIVFGDFLKVIRESISFQGLPGFLSAIFLLSVAARGLIALIPILVSEFQTLFLGVLEVRTAMSALAAQDAVAFGSSLLALGPAIVTVVALTAALGGLIYLLVSSGKSTEDLAAALEHVNKQAQAFGEAQQQFGQERNLRAIIEDYKQLAAQTTRNSEETASFGKDLTVLTGYFTRAE